MGLNIHWKNTTVLGVLFVVICLKSAFSQSCSLSRTCDSCLRLHSGCVWCKDKEFGNKPRCMEEREGLTSQCTELASRKQSTYKSRAVGSQSFVTPKSVKVTLEYGSPVTVPLEIRIPDNVSKKNKLLLKYKGSGKDYRQNIQILNYKRTYRKGTKQFIKNLTGSTVVKVNYTFEATTCGTNKQKQTLIVRFAAKGQRHVKQKVKVVLQKTDCPCSCQDMQKDSAQCSGYGNLECGVCTCHEGYYGENCEFDMDPKLLAHRCIAPESDKACSGHGNCIAGFCDCNAIGPNTAKKYSGRFCQCNDFSCSYHNNQMCGGNGQCQCGLCVCHEGFIGDSCECPTSVDTCTASNGDIQKDSPQCSGNGNLECGVCTCHEGYYGKNCEFDMDPKLLAHLCMAPESDKACSGHGNCIAGFCDCNAIGPNTARRYSGRFCQCNDFSCSYHNNQMCGGNGRCQCGLCACNEGFIGDSCECPTSVDTCTASNGKVCNGHGTCVCGMCLCDRYSSYMGPTCEECPTCPGRCSRLKPCVLCKGFGTGQYNVMECYEKCRVDNIKIVHKLEDPTPDDQRLCQFHDDSDGCLVRFTYQYSASPSQTFVESIKRCPGL